MWNIPLLHSAVMHLQIRDFVKEFRQACRYCSIFVWLPIKFLKSLYVIYILKVSPVIAFPGFINKATWHSLERHWDSMAITGKTLRQHGTNWKGTLFQHFSYYSSDYKYVLWIHYLRNPVGYSWSFWTTSSN